MCDVLDLLAEPGSPVPVTTRRDAPLPGWVGPLDLVIAVSQSGRAAGPLALAAEAARRGASLLTVGAAGSPLADVSARARGVHVDVAIPTPSSRTALWSMLTPVLVAADVLGLARCPPPVLERVADVLDEVAEECRPSSESFVNPAKVLAVGLGETVPVVLGDGPLTGVAATRAASMLARTARVPATHGALPTRHPRSSPASTGPSAPACPAPSGPRRRRHLRRPLPRRPGHPAPRPARPARPRPRAAATRPGRRRGRLRPRGRRHGARAGGPLREPVERLASLVALTDFAATYLAIGLGLDPSVSRHVAELRDRTG